MKRPSFVFVGVLALALLLSACGRDAAVTLAEGESDSASASTGGMGDDRASEEPAGEGSAEPDEDAPQPQQSDPVASPRSGSVKGSSGSGRVHATPGADEPRQGIDVGEPNPGAPDCPECTGSGPGQEDPPPRPNPYTTASPGQEDVRARPWESAEVHPDDVTVTITWWSGVEPCHVLDRVEVREAAEQVTITLYEGQQPGFSGACTAQAVQKRTQVKLSQPLKGRPIMDGAAAK